MFIVDDVAFIKAEEGDEIARQLERRHIRKQYYLETRCDVLLRNEEVFRRWRRLGLNYMFLGLEALDEEGLTAFRKRTTPQVNNKALEVARSMGLSVAINIIADPDWDETRFAFVFTSPPSALPLDSEPLTCTGVFHVPPGPGREATRASPPSCQIAYILSWYGDVELWSTHSEALSVEVLVGERLESHVQLPPEASLKQRTFATRGGLLTTPIASAQAVPSEVQSTAGSL